MIRREKKSSHPYSINRSNYIGFEILYLVIEIYCMICKGKEDIERRWDKSYWCKRYPKRIGIEWRHSKTVLGSKSRDPQYDLKKHIEELKINTSTTESILLFQDEEGPIAAKTYGCGTSWCSTQAKVENTQRIKEILNVFGIYDYTNDRMFSIPLLQKEEQQRIHRFYSVVLT